MRGVEYLIDIMSSLQLVPSKKIISVLFPHKLFLFSFLYYITNSHKSRSYDVFSKYRYRVCSD